MEPLTPDERGEIEAWFRESMTVRAIAEAEAKLALAAKRRGEEEGAGEFLRAVLHPSDRAWLEALIDELAS